MEPAFDELSPEERIRLVQDLWDRIAASPQDVPVSEAVRQELQRRLADHHHSPDDVIPWEEVKKSGP
jgi:putative addiction module component (TIGR02574 family)